MLETNIRIVKPGTRLYIKVRRLSARGQNLGPDLLERICSNLRHDHKVPTVKMVDSNCVLLAATNRIIEPYLYEFDNLKITVADSNEPANILSLTNHEEENQIRILIERALLVRLEQNSKLWTLGSPRIWYEATPFHSENGISVYRRHEVAALCIKDVGIGVVADIGTAFFTERNLDYFFDYTIPNLERQEHEKRFNELTSRQQGQKGTLLYDLGRRKLVCYFEDAPLGITCATTGEINIDRETYPSLYHYYKANRPYLPVDQSSTAVRVSFRGLNRPTYVAAKLLKVRVMNENLPDSISSIAKIPPHQRKHLLEEFWQQLEPRPLGDIAPGLYPGFWKPDEKHVLGFNLPELEYGNNTKIYASANRSLSAVKSHYKNRLDLLKSAHCYRIPPSTPRTVYCSYPDSLEDTAVEKFADDMASLLTNVTGLAFQSIMVKYENLNEAYDKLHQETSNGVVVFILNEEPAAYYDAAFNMPGWRVKRVTDSTFAQHYRYFSKGVWDRRENTFNEERGVKRWNSFVTMNTLAVLQLLDVAPYRISQAGTYEGQLVIDVGRNKRCFALSLLIARKNNPDFIICSDVQHKADTKHEYINPVILKNEIVKLFKSAMGRTFDPLGSLLILRDGNLQGKELPGINQAIGTLLNELRMLRKDSRVDIVSIHKGTLSYIRLWEIDSEDRISNPIEGSGVLLTNYMAVLATTGEVTLTQGTADPVVLVADQNKSVEDATLSVFEAAQLNWSSPNVAQRLPLPLKRTDEDLMAKDAQEILRIA